ncbi:MAG: hypothetical protein AAF585_27365 [Verrucomicrobiota bacterium]
MMVWLWGIGQSTGLKAEWPTVVALFCAVWAVYLGDRLVDVARCQDWSHATERLAFGKRFRALFVSCLVLCVITGATLCFTALPNDVIRRGLMVAVGMGIYVSLFVYPWIFGRKAWGKELLVGVGFSCGVFAALGPGDALQLQLLASVALAVAFNCLIIGARDADADRANDPGGVSHWWKSIDRDLKLVGLGLTTAYIFGSVFFANTKMWPALIICGALLTILHFNARRFSADSIRALADYCLMTPLLFVWW